MISVTENDVCLSPITTPMYANFKNFGHRKFEPVFKKSLKVFQNIFAKTGKMVTPFDQFARIPD